MTSADKVLCPWCGAEMEINTKEFNRRHSARMECHNSECNARGPMTKWHDTEEKAIENARAAALHRYTPPIKPVTLKELWKEDEPMWVEQKNGALYIGDFYVSMSTKNAWDVQTLGSAKSRLLLEDYYGKTWRCWERVPTDEERSAAEWEK